MFPFERLAKVTELRTRDHILLPYMAMAPFPLAFERYMEAEIFARHGLKRPILDIGCGEGLFARMTFDGKIDTGIDPDARELKRAAELDGYGELIQCYGASIPKPDGSYATIISNSVLEHIEDLEPVLREAHRLLAPDGVLYCTVPSDKFDQFTVVNSVLTSLGLKGLSARYRKFFNSFWRHYHYYSLAGWETFIQSCGFEVREAYTYNPRETCVLNDFLAPFSVFSFVIKRLTNRWILIPSLRRLLAYPVCLWAKGFLRDRSPVPDGGLVFISAIKRG
jgi:SAM-dependent methyltransferase